MRNITILLPLAFFIGCAGPKVGPDLSPEATRRTMSGIPDWVYNNPEKEGFRYQSGTATSSDLQTAIDKASLSAGSNLAAKIESEFEAYTERVIEEVGNRDGTSNLLDRFKQTQSNTLAKVLKDYRDDKKSILEENSNGQNIFRVYVLIEWDEMAAEKRILDKIKADKEIYDAIRASDLVKEKERKVAEYRKRMNAN